MQEIKSRNLKPCSIILSQLALNRLVFLAFDFTTILFFYFLFFSLLFAFYFFISVL